MFVSTFFTAIQGLIVTVAAGTGAIVAVLGLNAWQRQLKGKANYELARRLLTTFYKYRDAIEAVRHPAMWNNEMPYPEPDKAKGMSDAHIRHFGVAGAYQARWEKVKEQRVNLYPDLIEAEAIWGSELKSLFSSVISIEGELLHEIEDYLEVLNPDTDQETKDAIFQIRNGKRKVRYATLSARKDDYKEELQAALKPIEIYLRSKLHNK